MNAPGWRVGAAAVPFPVSQGVPLGGYLARTGKATGTHDPLQIGALALECGEQRLVILTVDVVALDRLLIDRLRCATDLADGELLVCASHTHSGPAGIADLLHPAWPPTADEAMRDRFAALASECITTARHRLEPAMLSFASAEPEQPVWSNRNDPDGPADRRVSTLVARRWDGSLTAVLLHFACHPTVLGHDNLRVSADLAGATRRALAARLGDPPASILFANGAAGDTSTRYTRSKRTFAVCELLGGLTGQAAHAAIIEAAATAPLRPSLAHGRSLCQLIRAAAGLDAGAPASPDDLRDQATPAGRIATTRRQGADLLQRGAGMPWPATIPLDVWVLGDEVALLAVPGELTAVPAWLIETASPFAQTRIIGYANGYNGYLPDLALYDAGTYESLASPYATGCGERIAQSGVALLRSLA